MDRPQHVQVRTSAPVFASRSAQGHRAIHGIYRIVVELDARGEIGRLEALANFANVLTTAAGARPANRPVPPLPPQNFYAAPWPAAPPHAVPPGPRYAAGPVPAFPMPAPPAAPAPVLAASYDLPPAPPGWDPQVPPGGAYAPAALPASWPPTSPVRGPTSGLQPPQSPQREAETTPLQALPSGSGGGDSSGSDPLGSSPTGEQTLPADSRPKKRVRRKEKVPSQELVAATLAMLDYLRGLADPPRGDIDLLVAVLASWRGESYANIAAYFNVTMHKVRGAKNRLFLRGPQAFAPPQPGAGKSKDKGKQKATVQTA